MTRKLQFLFTALLLSLGVTSAWAQTTIYASKQINFRTNSNSSPTGWDTGDWAAPKTNKDGLNIESIEANTKNAKPIFALEQFEIPNWSNVKSITITHKGTVNGAGLAVWLFPYTFYEADDYNSDFVGNTKTVLGVFPGGEYTKTPAGTGTDAISLTLDVAQNKINNTSFASFVSDNKLTLNVLLTSTNAATSQTKIYSANTTNAENRPYLTVTYNTAYIGSIGYETLADAFSAAVTADADAEIKIYDDQTLTARQTWNKAHSLTITPMADITIKGPNNAGWFWTNVNSAALTIGSDGHSITFDGDSKEYSANITRRENNSTLTLKNVAFENFDFNNNANALVNCNNSSGNIILDGVTINNCTNTSKGFIYSERTVNGQITLKDYLNLDATSYASAPAICSTNKSSSPSENGSIIVDDDSFTASFAPLKISWDNAPTTIGYGPLVTGIDGLANATSLFDFNDASYGFYADGDNLKLTQAYTLSIGTAGAATLVLPFESTIPASPTGLTCYKLTYTSGDDITATAEESTLGADKPVLIIGTASTSYKFVSTATSGDAATGSGQTSAYGVLIGNYADDYVVSADNYILTNHSGVIGFRKANGTNNKVQAYRAYMDVTYFAGAPEFFGINFDGETTAIDKVDVKKEMTGEVYNLQGIRMQGENLPKGIYVKNGKKFVIK